MDSMHAGRQFPTAGKFFHIQVVVWIPFLLLFAASCRFDPVATAGSPQGVVCGNGLREAEEDCDGQDMGGASCKSLGYRGGALACGDDCRFDAAQCLGAGTCGNGIKDPGEDCDGNSLGGGTCGTVAGLSQGTLACDGGCRYDISGCHECGNGVLEAAEACDGTDFGTKTCQTVANKPDGYLTCGSSCTLIGSSHCHDCGDGHLEAGEDCDGTEFGGKTCSTYGLSAGELRCTEDCLIDTSSCRDSPCGNGVCSQGETAAACPQDCGWTALSTSKGWNGDPGHACGIRADGSLWCWGANDVGQLGDGTHIDRNLPVPVDLGGNAALSVSCGGRHTCALLEDASVWCWGLNNHGQLGLGMNVEDASAPLPLDNPQEVTGFSALDLGLNFSCALDQSNRVWCWGGHDRQVLGFPSNLDVFSPVHAVAVLDGIATTLTLGAEHSCVLASDGSVWCWGRDNKGQLGDGRQGPDRFDPQQVSTSAQPPGTLSAIGVTAGGQHTCAWDPSGIAWCWGLNDHGQLGDDGTSDSALPQGVVATNMGSATGLSAGPGVTCGLDGNRGLWCWGLNDHGQLGIGQTSDDELVPVAHGTLNSGVEQVSVGPGFVCALDDGARLWCWGRNDHGQLGAGNWDDSHVPVEVADP